MQGAFRGGRGRRRVPDAPAARAVGDPQGARPRRHPHLRRRHAQAVDRAACSRPTSRTRCSSPTASRAWASRCRRRSPPSSSTPTARSSRSSGDGGFLMNCQELETAKRLKTAVVNVIWENQQYGSIVWKQDNKFGRHFGVDFTNPDFVQLAQAFGLPGLPLRVRRGLRARTSTRRWRSTSRRSSWCRSTTRRTSGCRSSSERRRWRHEPSKQVLDAVKTGLFIGGEWRDAAATLDGRGPVDGRDDRRGRRRDARRRAGGDRRRRRHARPEWAATRAARPRRDPAPAPSS